MVLTQNKIVAPGVIHRFTRKAISFARLSAVVLAKFAGSIASFGPEAILLSYAIR